jgi:hypothetical protein
MNMQVTNNKILPLPLADKNLIIIIVKRLSFITGLILLVFLVACRGPLAKPGAAVKKGENPMDASKSMGTNRMETPKVTKEDIKIESVQGGITIATLFSDKKNYSGKTVKIRGKVTKVNPSIMGKNWIHLQDGTEFEGLFDLTITSDFVPGVGSTITVEGKIALDKDFGYGYTYPVLMEEGKLVQ